MVKFVSAALAAGFLFGVTAPAFANDDHPKTEAECVKMKMKWDAATKTCTKH